MRRTLGSISLFSLTLFLAIPAFAQSTRVYVMPQSDGSEIAQAIEDARASLTGPLTSEGGFAIAGDLEMDRLVSQCIDETGVGPDERRRCRLNVARRVFVTWVHVVSGRELGDDSYELQLEVIDPDQAQSPYVTRAEVRGQGLELAVRQGLGEVASDLIAWSQRGEEGATGFLEVMRLGGDVRAATVCVNGAEVGTAPGQYEVSGGAARVEVSAVGYLPFSAEVNVPAGELYEMPEVTLEPVPSVIHVTSNVHDAAIRIDGRAAGSTWGNGSVRFELSPGQHQIEVTREGWGQFSQEVTLGAGEFRPVSANLTPEGR